MHLRLRVIAGALTIATAVTGLGTVARAGAVASHCEANPPDSPDDYQRVADARDSQFGVGDITSVTDLPDGRRLFTYGDTGYYDVRADGSPGPMRGFGNNSAWLQSGKCFTLLDRDRRSWLLPPEVDGSVYWPGATVVVGSRLYVFVARVRTDNIWGTPVGAAIAIFDLPSMQLARIVPMPWLRTRVYGGGAVYDDGYIYAYGSQARTCDLCFAADMYVARIREDQIFLPGAWRYKAGASWVSDPRAATPVLPAAVSNTNVQRYGNGYLLVTKTYGIVGPDVEAWWAPTPTGPWQDLGLVAQVPDPPLSKAAGYTYRKPFTYNVVVAASARMRDGGLLAAYNVGSFDTADAQRDGRMGPRFFSIAIPTAPVAPARPKVTPRPSAWTPTYAVDRLGRVSTIDGGVAVTASHTTRAVAVARTPTGRGCWVAAADGSVYAFGDAPFLGSMGGKHLNQPIVGITGTPTGRGYWLLARDGGMFAYGDARFLGGTGGIRLNRPILAMSATPSGKGYWLVASDGGMFSYGDARFYGSLGRAHLRVPVTAMGTTPDGRGYWLVTLLGEVYTFGDAPYRGNAPWPPRAAVIGIVPAPGGYRLVDTAGHVFIRSIWPETKRLPNLAPVVGAG